MGVHFKITRYDEEFIPPDDGRPAAVSVKVLVDGLVAGKATVEIDGWTRHSAKEAEEVARHRAVELAASRVSRWERAIKQWAEWEAAR